MQSHISLRDCHGVHKNLQSILKHNKLKKLKKDMY